MSMTRSPGAAPDTESRLCYGVVADDITGAADLASALAARGLTTVQAIGVTDAFPTDRDAVVIALKTRTAPAGRAADHTAEASRRLRQAGARRVYFKYCSTFDSTDAGNIGPVSDRLREQLGGRTVVHCPAYPENDRTVYLGHLFVGSSLLSESGMARHPLTPMKDANLVRVLSRQTPHPVAGLPLRTVVQGVAATRAAIAKLRDDGFRHIVADAIDDRQVETLAQAVATLPDVLAAGGAAFGAAYGYSTRPVPGGPVTAAEGSMAIVVGSASAATGEQVRTFRPAGDVLLLPPGTLCDNSRALRTATDWLDERRPGRAVLIGVDQGDPAAPGPTGSPFQPGPQARQPDSGTAARIEAALAAIAVELVRRGVRRLVVAGGETSGAVADALGLSLLAVGPAIAPGVPWLRSSQPDLHIAFKSGNFGGPDFFLRCLTGSSATGER